jgi:copper(I)-binding protein
VSGRRRGFAPMGRLVIAAAAVGLIPAVAGCEAGSNAPTLEYHPQSAGTDAAVHGIDIRDAFVLGAPIGSTLAAGQSAGLFIALFNQGHRDTLTSISAPGVAASVTLPGGRIQLGDLQPVYLTGPAPKIILTDLIKPLAGGTAIRITLSFAKAGNVTISVPVLPRSNDYSTFQPAPSPVKSGSATATPVPSKSPSPTPAS